MRINIQYKITIVFAAISAFILFGVYIYLQNHLTDQIFKQLQANLHGKINLAARYLQQQYSPRLSLPQIDKIADAISEDLDLRVTVIAMDGRVLGDSNLTPEMVEKVENHLYRPEIQDAIKSGVGMSRRFSQTVKRELLYMAIPFTLPRAENSAGIIRLAVPLSEINKVTGGLTNFLLVALGIAFIVSLTLGFVGSHIISKPISEVSSISKSIAAGDFSKVVTIHSKDEFGDLSTSVNYMSKQIKERIEEVVASRLRLEAVLLSMFDGVLVMNADGKILLMNKALRELLQVTEEVVGKKPIEVIRNVEIQEIATEVLESKTGAISREISALFPREKHLIIHATPVTLHGVVDGAVMVFHNITELRRLEMVRKDFVANVSHELRTPITNIKGYAETLLEGALDDKSNAEDFTNIIHSEAERLAKLVEDVLDLSRIESGKMQFHFKPHDIGDLVKRVETGLSKQFTKRGITFRTEIPDDIGKVRCDGPSIAQVLLNLIENAVKYNKDNGLVTVSAQHKGRYVELSIADTGIGIPENDLPRIFERFYRVDKAHSREIGGTGLGLSIVKHIVQAHQGEVRVTSQTGVGSCFRFTLPLA
ncbi:MAG: HAMP domain-containing protein [Candidatus Omnitrophica bacterium]|nr:HAMP domain-containing protein [Candidatus Omnitrophota bacterium]MCB9720971.1 HAMP domain-containing protein [Candidatus Omnitrophota bacterium]